MVIIYPGYKWTWKFETNKATEIESTAHFLLHCHHYANICLTALNGIFEIIGNTFNIISECLGNLVLLGSRKYAEIDNSHIINTHIKYFLGSDRFSGPLHWITKHFDFDYIYDWLNIELLFIFNPNAYDKLLGHSSGSVRFYMFLLFL